MKMKWNPVHRSFVFPQYHYDAQKTKRLMDKELADGSSVWENVKEDNQYGRWLLTLLRTLREMRPINRKIL